MATDNGLINLTFRTTAEQRAYLEKAAREEECSVSLVLRRIIRGAMSKPHDDMRQTG